MPVERKMAVGFWQMQTFEMAVRKDGFVPNRVLRDIGSSRPSSVVFHHLIERMVSWEADMLLLRSHIDLAP